MSYCFTAISVHNVLMTIQMLWLSQIGNRNTANNYFVLITPIIGCQDTITNSSHPKTVKYPGSRYFWVIFPYSITIWSPNFQSSHEVLIFNPVNHARFSFPITGSQARLVILNFNFSCQVTIPDPNHPCEVPIPYFNNPYKNPIPDSNRTREFPILYPKQSDCPLFGQCRF